MRRRWRVRRRTSPPELKRCRAADLLTARAGQVLWPEAALNIDFITDGEDETVVVVGVMLGRYVTIALSPDDLVDYR